MGELNKYLCQTQLFCSFFVVGLASFGLLLQHLFDFVCDPSIQTQLQRMYQSSFCSNNTGTAETNKRSTPRECTEKSKVLLAEFQ